MHGEFHGELLTGQKLSVCLSAYSNQGGIKTVLPPSEWE